LPGTSVQRGRQSYRRMKNRGICVGNGRMFDPLAVINPCRHCDYCGLAAEARGSRV